MATQKGDVKARSYKRVSREKLMDSVCPALRGIPHEAVLAEALRLRRLSLTIAEIGDHLFPAREDGAGLVEQLLEGQPRHIRFKGDIGHIPVGYGKHQANLPPDHG